MGGQLTGTELRSPEGLLALEAAGLKGKKLLAVLAGESEAPDLEPHLEQAAERLAGEQTLGFTHVCFGDDAYPERLRSIASPPPLLRVIGSVACLSGTRLLAVAGTREPSRFGLTATATVVKAAAERGFGVVSGLARGVDSAGHRAALDAGVPTIAVLGSGLDRLYPPDNRGLAAEIVDAGGALVSELGAGVAVAPRQLIARNRLQTGLSLGLFVGQTGLKGGTPHTVRFALEQGRPVWCPRPQEPGPRSEGLLALLDHDAGELPLLMPAFKQARALVSRHKGPVARPVTRETMDEMLLALEQLARA